MWTSVEPYVRGWLARRAAREAERERARATAWDAARRAAHVLRTDHGATRVVVFGSLARGDWMPAHSDIDLAVEGICDGEYLAAHGAALSAARGPVDLIRLELAAPGLRRCIEAEGRELV